MSFIKINDAESLNINTIQSYKASEREVPKEHKRETVLTITKNDGKHVTLSGALAEAALAILRQHGC
jgi:hypothetical protein